MSRSVSEEIVGILWLILASQTQGWLHGAALALAGFALIAAVVLAIWPDWLARGEQP
jgi:hypothetical protein